VFKKTHLKEMADFCNPKNVTIGSRVDQTQKTPSFNPIGQKSPILNENLVLEQFPM